MLEFEPRSSSILSMCFTPDLRSLPSGAVFWPICWQLSGPLMSQLLGCCFSSYRGYFDSLWCHRYQDCSRSVRSRGCVHLFELLRKRQCNIDSKKEELTLCPDNVRNQFTQYLRALRRRQQMTEFSGYKTRESLLTIHKDTIMGVTLAV